MIREITTQYGGICASCEERIPAGARVKWSTDARDVIWHSDCPTPRSLQLYEREAIERNKLNPR